MGPEQLIKQLREKAKILKEENLEGLAYLLNLAALCIENQEIKIRNLEQETLV